MLNVNVALDSSDEMDFALAHGKLVSAHLKNRTQWRTIDDAFHTDE